MYNFENIDPDEKKKGPPEDNLLEFIHNFFKTLSFIVSKSELHVSFPAIEQGACHLGNLR